MRVELPGDAVLEGTATDVEADGRLVVLDVCGITHRLAAGDVVHLRTGRECRTIPGGPPVA